MASYTTKADITVLKNGSVEVVYEIEPGVFVELDEFVKYKKQEAEGKKTRLAGEVAAAGKLSKKARVKAFLKRVIEKRRKSKKESFSGELEEYQKVIKIIAEASKLFEETAYGFQTPRFHRKDGDFVYPSDAKGDWFSKLLEEKLEEHDMNYGMGKLILDFWDNKFIGRYGRLMEDAFEDFGKVIKAIKKAGLRLLEGKPGSLWFIKEDVEPPYNPYLTSEELDEAFGNLFDTATLHFENEITFKDEEQQEEDDEYDDEKPFTYEVGVSLTLKPGAKLMPFTPKPKKETPAPPKPAAKPAPAPAPSAVGAGAGGAPPPAADSKSYKEYLTERKKATLATAKKYGLVKGTKYEKKNPVSFEEGVKIYMEGGNVKPEHREHIIKSTFGGKKKEQYYIHYSGTSIALHSESSIEHFKKTREEENKK